MYEEFLLKLWSRKNTPLFIFLARLSLFPSQLLQKFPLFLNFNIPSPLYCYFSSLSLPLPFNAQHSRLSEIFMNLQWIFYMQQQQKKEREKLKVFVCTCMMHFLAVLCRHFNGFVCASSNHSLTNFITQARKAVISNFIFRCRTQEVFRRLVSPLHWIFLHVR